MTDDALIHLRVPAGLKARWVRESRAAGMRLTDWIIQRMETTVTKPVPISIPADLPFSALQLSRDAAGSVSFSTETIAQVERASGLPEGFFMAQDEDAIASVIVAWYSHHRTAGGDMDSVAEDLIAEVRAEDAAGQPYSHQPGSA